MQIHFRETRFDEVRNVLLRHAFFKGGKCGAKHVKGGVASQTHEFQFVRGLVPAASNRYRVGGSVFKSGCGIAQMIEKCEAGGFFNSNSPRANVLIGQCGSCDFCGALILLPNTDFDRQMKLFAQPSLLKRRNHKHRMAAARDDQTHQPLAETPSNSSEVVERGTRRKEKRVVLSRLRGRTARRERRSGHKLVRPFNTLLKFIRSNGVSAVAEPLERREGGRERLVPLREVTTYRKSRNYSQSRQSSSGLEKPSA